MWVYRAFGFNWVFSRSIFRWPARPNLKYPTLRVTLGRTPSWVKSRRFSKRWYHRISDDGTTYLQIDFDSPSGIYRLTFGDGTRFWVDLLHGRIAVIWKEPQIDLDAISYLFGAVAGFILFLKGVQVLHGSVLSDGHHAFALIGPSGSGKSTTAAALSLRGWRVLTEDVIAVEISRGKTFVHSGPPWIRLWDPSASALFSNQKALLRYSPVWDKKVFNLSSRQHIARKLPLRAIYFLGSRRDAQSPIRPATFTEGFLGLMANHYTVRMLTPQSTQACAKQSEKILQEVQLRWVTPPPRLARISNLVAAIEKDLKRSGFKRDLR